MTIAISNHAPDLPSDIPFMPFSVRLMLAATINEAWKEFVGNMDDGPVTGDTPELFWKFLCHGS